MLLIGVIEMVAAILVTIKPRIGAYVVSAWLLGIVINLLIIPGYFDIAAAGLWISARRAGARPAQRGIPLVKPPQQGQWI
jgi:hypothetical protein